MIQVGIESVIPWTKTLPELPAVTTLEYDSQSNKVISYQHPDQETVTDTKKSVVL